MVYTPKSEAEKALDLRHFPDCIAGCECNAVAQPPIVEHGCGNVEEGQEGGNVVTSVAGSAGICKVTNVPAADTQMI